MLKIGLVSDLHTEFWNPSDRSTIAEVIQRRLADADLILMPGDIATGSASIAVAQELFPDRSVCLIAGNHEFYERDYNKTVDDLHVAAGRNVRFLDKTTAVMEINRTFIRVIGCTLWTDFLLHGTRELSLLDAKQLNDFRLIRYQDRILRPADTLEWHIQEREWLIGQLETPFDGVTIVMTHHAPVAFAIAPEFNGDALSPCFASNLEPMLAPKNAALVVWGHTHHCVDRMIGNTRYVSNQTGYPGRVTRSALPTETGEFGQIIVVE